MNHGLFGFDIFTYFMIFESMIFKQVYLDFPNIRRCLLMQLTLIEIKSKIKFALFMEQ